MHDFFTIVRAMKRHIMNSKVDDLDLLVAKTPPQNIVKATKKEKNTKYSRNTAESVNYVITITVSTNKESYILGVYITFNDIVIVLCTII